MVELNHRLYMVVNKFFPNAEKCLFPVLEKKMVIYAEKFLTRFFLECKVSSMVKKPDLKNQGEAGRMRKKHRKEMFLKITKYLSKKIEHLGTDEEFLLQEISDRTGISINRLSEIKNHHKYKWPVNERYLANFIGGGIVTIKEILENVDLTDEEKKELEGMTIYDLVQAARRRGHDVESVLKHLAVRDPEQKE